MEQYNDESPQALYKQRRLWELFGGLVVLFAALLLFASLGQSPSALARSVSTAVCGILGSLASALLVAGMLRLDRERGEKKRRSRLLKLIGLRSSYSKVAIVLPRFDVDGLPTGHRRSYVPPIVDGAIKDTRLTVRAQVAFDDVVAIRHVSAMFGRQGLPSPTIIFDGDARQNLFPTSPPVDGPDKGTVADDRYDAYIMVGLFSNRATMQLAESRLDKDQRLFKLTTLTDFQAGVRGVEICPQDVGPSAWREAGLAPPKSRAANILRDMNKPNALDPDQEDFALIAKCRAPDGTPCIILGGGAARGTRKAAAYFGENWESLLDESHLRDKRRVKLENHCFAAAYYIPEGKGKYLVKKDLHIGE